MQRPIGTPAVCALLLCALATVGQQPAETAGARAGSNTARLLGDRFQRMKRERATFQPRALPGQRPAELLHHAYQQKMILRAQRTKQNAAGHGVPLFAGSGWSPLGPAPFPSNPSSAGYQLYGPVSGRATAVAIDPADQSGNTVFAGGANGGLWRSTNAGSLSPDPASVLWTPLIDDQPSLAVGAIAIQPGSVNASRSLVLVGTGETNSSTDSYYGQGILRGAGNGDGSWTWTLIPQDTTGTHSFLGLGFSQIAFSSDNPSLAVAATAGSSLGEIENAANSATSDLGLYYSQDAGLHWTYAAVTDSGTAVTPGSATAVVYNQAAHQFFAILRFHGVYSSPDGANWTRLASQPGGPGLSPSFCPAVPGAISCPIYRGELAVVPGRNEMYAWYVDVSNTDEGIWGSRDGGTSWPLSVSTTAIDACGDPLGGCGTQDGSYNLALAAVPNGAGNTDLYAGAVNLYKCFIASTPSATSACNPVPGNGFLNLTHAYGCAPDLGSPAHVHPSQHAIAFLEVNDAQAVMYFANDGGIYRTLDGYSRLTSGGCSTANGFDNLNQTLGSMTQVISFAQSPSDPNTMLAGAQANGFPATASAFSGGGWSTNVNTSGGFVQINPIPGHQDEWFTAASGPNIQRCGNGSQCHAEDFAAGLIVSSATLQGDAGAPDTPFLIDPAILAAGGAADLVVGTCRVWRGGIDGGSFTALSQDFDTGSNGTVCGGNEINLVRSLAAGGPLDPSGASSMIYAGTSGWGPLVVTNPSGGHVWVSDPHNPGTFIDRTGLGSSNINPQQFPISALLVDDTDLSVTPGTGVVAYAALMGFTPHAVWKTTSAGAGWIDMVANPAGSAFSLPEAPVNALALDPGDATTPGTLYVGTDVGVFARSADPYTMNVPVWTEVGPAPSTGQVGFLPNVPVTALAIYNDGVTKLLRAATYGRGVWQYVLSQTPAFLIAASGADQTVFSPLTTSFAVTLTAVNGYNSTVTLSCSDGATPSPPTCSIPPTATPSPAGTSFNLIAGGPPQDYLFNIQATGPGAQAPLQRSAALTLHVVNYDISPPTVSNPTLNRGGPSQPIDFNLTAAGSFSGIVTLSCDGLPTGTACNFSSSTANPTAAQSVPITLTITSTSDVHTAANIPVTIVATTPGGPPRMQNLSLTVTANQDYTLTLNPSTVSAVAGQQQTLQGTLTALNGYSSAVNLTCGGNPPPTCNISPAGQVPAAGGAQFQVTLGSGSVNQYKFDIVAAGTDASTTTHNAAVTFNSTFGFSMNAVPPPSQKVLAGGTGTYTLDLSPAGGSFLNPVSFSCTGLPALSTCSFSPAQVASGSPETQVTLAISTTAPLLALARPSTWPITGFAFAAVALLFAGSTRRHSPLLRAGTIFLVIAVATAGCGGGSNNSGGGGQPGTPAGIYQVTVTATAGASGQPNFATQQLQLTLMVQ